MTKQRLRKCGVARNGHWLGLTGQLPTARVGRVQRLGRVHTGAESAGYGKRVALIPGFGQPGTVSGSVSYPWLHERRRRG